MKPSLQNIHNLNIVKNSVSIKNNKVNEEGAKVAYNLALIGAAYGSGAGFFLGFFGVAVTEISIGISFAPEIMLAVSEATTLHQMTAAAAVAAHCFSACSLVASCAPLVIVSTTIIGAGISGYMVYNCLIT